MPTDRHKSALGGLCIAFQSVEIRLCFLTWCLIAKDQRIGQIITSSMSFSRVCDCVVALAKYRFGEESSEAKDITDCVKEAAALEQQRNTFIHSYWTAPRGDNDPGRIKFSLSRKKGFISHSENIAPEDIEPTSEKANGLSNRIMNVIGQMGQKTS